MIDKTGAIASMINAAQGVGTQGPTAINKGLQAEKGSFGEIIGQVLESASAAAEKASNLNTRLQMDDPNVTLEESVIASNVSSLQFTAIVQTRNKVMQAYNDIMNMPI